jgi:flagellar biosynthesis/type III secretory pathway protein FliH
LRRGKVVDGASAERFSIPIEPTPAEVEQAQQAAERAGFLKGIERGEAEARARSVADRERAQQHLASSLAALHTLESRILAGAKNQLLELALQIASRIVRERVASDDPIAQRVAEELISKGALDGEIVVRVHPDDCVRLESAAPELSQRGAVKLVSDTAIEPGGAIVESSAEQLDARLSTQLARYRDALEELK